eukprot:398365_1
MSYNSKSNSLMKVPISRKCVFNRNHVICMIVTWIIMAIISTTKYEKLTTNTTIKYENHNYNFGIILFAYSNDEEWREHYLNETNNLCNNLKTKNLQDIQHLKITLFVNKPYIYSINDNNQCKFDKIIFVNKSISKSLNSNTREFSTRIKLLLQSPYQITMALDSDMYCCHSLNFMKLLNEMENKNIDFAYTSFKKTNIPQGGLFLYKNNNSTRNLINRWYKYHTTNHKFDDQDTLHYTINM